MASFSLIGLLVVFSCCVIQSIKAKEGFILTVPQVLRAGTESEFCVTIHAPEPRALDVNLLKNEEGLSQVKISKIYQPDEQTCTSFRVPAPGEYELLLSNATDILHEVVEIIVLPAAPITLVQTDKPMYKPGQMVKFRIMTLLTDFKPRMGKIESVYIKDPNQFKVKQFLNVETKGLTSLQFQLSKEAKLGQWSILVMMANSSSQQVNFEVKEYVLPRFEVSINPPPFVLHDSEIIEGSVCAKYTYGKDVQGYLDLELCWGYSHGSLSGECHHEFVEINGCYNWTANMTQLTMYTNYLYYGSELQVRASVSEQGTGFIVNKTHSGPKTTNERLKIAITDYTNGFFKPRLPYIGKITVQNPDGSPAEGEEITVTANDYKNNIRYANTFVTDDKGVIAYSLCESFTEETTSISIEAVANKHKVEQSSTWQRRGLHTPRAYFEVRQWFSPSLSYIQIPRSDLNLKCGDRFTHGIPFTTRAGQDVKFTYQVKTRGQIVKTGHVQHNASANFPRLDTVKFSQFSCLKLQIVSTQPPETTEMPKPPPIPKDTSDSVKKIEIIPITEIDEEIEEMDEMEEIGDEPPILPSGPDVPPPPIMGPDGEPLRSPSGQDVPPPPIMGPDGEPLGPDDSEPSWTEGVPVPVSDISDEQPPELTAMPPIEDFKEPVQRAEVVSDTVSTFLLDMEISTEMSPRFTLIVYHVMEDGEVVADSMEFEVEPCFGNDVKMTFNKSTVLPGEKVGINLKASPGSVCGVGVVDKSINILGGKHQITMETVFKRLEDMSKPAYVPLPRGYRDNSDYCENRINKILAAQGYNTDPSEATLSYNYWHYTSSFVDAFQAFKAAGLIVVTNLNLETRPCERSYPMLFYDTIAFSRESGGVPGPLAAVPEMAGGGPMALAGQSRPNTVRTKFPETWLWDLVLVGESGESVETKIAPDTITSWVGNAMCIEKTKGFGVSPMTNLITFQPFFVSLNLPYAAVRGERLPIILTIYNYLEKCLNIQWNMDGGDYFQVQYKGENSVCICGGRSHSARFYVTPKDIGKLDIMAKAEVIPGLCGNGVETETGYEGYTDAVKRKMLVKAEGVTQEYTSSLYMCAEEGKPKMEEVILPLPDKLVADSARGQFNVIGDIMGPALTNLDNLVRIPTGCGEQNMVGFVPNILVMKYLIGTGRLTEEIEDKAISNMEIGYQRELNYRHRDGSFSAFGPSDKAGSVWLTAFVVKSFAMAKPWIFIDEADMNKSISFLKRSQLENGCFRETGKVFSSYMMGGLAKGKNRDSFKALTAYVLIALLKANVNKSESVIEDAVECLNRDFKKTKNKMDPYTLALVAYANTLYMPYSHVSTDVMRQLGKKSIKKGTFRYWRRAGPQAKPVNTWHYITAPSAEVEMTSYALLAYLNFYGENAVAQTFDIAMWISQQRSPRGGFASTQDTVVGLNALAEFAELTFDDSKSTDLKVDFDSKDLMKGVNVSESQKTMLLLQTRPIPSLPNKVLIKAEGTGCALVQANVQYNLMPNTLKGESRPNFYLRINPQSYKLDRNRCDRKTLVITVGARGGQKFATGMTLVSLKMVTSWYPVKDSLKRLMLLQRPHGMERHEYDEEEGVLTLYFDELSRKPQQFSIDVEQDKDLKVSNPKPAEIRVFQYYETDVSMTKSYKIKTICGTKAEIPRRPLPGGPFMPWGGGPWMPGRPIFQVRIPSIELAVEELIPMNVSDDCPICVDSRFIPNNLEDLVCNSTAIYKAISGRNASNPIKLRADMRPDKVQKSLNIFVKYDLPEGCKCSLLTPPTRRVMIFVDTTLKKRKLTLTNKSVITLSHRKLDRAVRKFQNKCDKE